MLKRLIQRTFVGNTPGKAEVSPSVKKSEGQAKGESLEEAPGSPVLSPILHLSPETVAPSQLLKWILYIQVILQLFTNLQNDPTFLVLLNVRCHPCLTILAYKTSVCL